MLYKDYLKKLKNCPFCFLNKNEIIKQNKYAILTLSKSPYTKDHLLVVPKKHAIKLSKLTKRQKKGIEKLIEYGMKLLYKKHKDLTILYREGNKKRIGKSIDHLHYHIIPNIHIGTNSINWKDRKIYSEKEYVKFIKSLK